MRKQLFAAVVPLVVASMPASAAVIDFTDLPGSNGAPLGSYTEEGFTVTNLSNFLVGTAVGNPANSIVALGVQNGVTDGTGSFRLTASGGEDFFLASFDVFPDGNFSPVLDFEVIGTLNGSTVFDVSGFADGSSFLTITLLTAGTLVDTVTFSFLGRGASYNVDNIVARLAPTTTSEVPEPATLALLGLGLAALAPAARRRKARA